jgi:FtsZ-binding cell division protein ZapB
MTAERLAEASRGLSNCLNAIDFACNKERMIAEWAGKWGTTLLAEAGRQSSVLTHIHEAIGEDPGSDDESLPDVVRQIVTEHQERITEQDAEIAALKAEDACDGTCEMLDRKANALQSERDALKDRLDALPGKIDGLRAQVSGLADALREIKRVLVNDFGGPCPADCNCSTCLALETTREALRAAEKKA